MRNSISSWITAAAASVTLVACGSSHKPYVYGPEQANVMVDGYPGARHPVPPEAPKGEVRVASFGVAKIRPAKDHPPVPTLHVRMIVMNNADPTPWIVDASKQEIAIEGEGRSRALYVNSDSKEAPVVHVPERDKRTLDFYFPLPANLDADKLPQFDFIWDVQTGEREVADRTIFQRQTVEDTDDYDRHTVLVAGWGPWWWYDPMYPGLVFAHPQTIVIRERVPPVEVKMDRPARQIFVGHAPSGPVRKKMR